MDKLQFQIESGDVLQLVEAHSDLAIKGWDESTAELSIDGEAQECTVEQQQGMLSIRSAVPLAVRIPQAMTVQVGQVHGDLVLLGLDGPVSVEEAHGDCAARSGKMDVSFGRVHGALTVEELGGCLNVSEAQSDVQLTNLGAVASLGRVGGDARVRGMEGDLKIGTVEGDARIHQVKGQIVLEQVQGTFKGTDLRGGMDVHVQGDLTLKTALTPGKAYTGQAQGDITVRVPADASARFTLKACGGISTRLLQVEEKEAGGVIGQMGNGEAEVVLDAGGHLSLKPGGDWAPGGDWKFEKGWGPAFAGFGAEFGADFGADFGETIAAQVRAHMADHFGDANWDAIAQEEIEKTMSKLEHKIERARRQAEEAACRAGEKAQRAQERVQRHVEDAARRAEEQAQRAQERAQRAAERAGRHAHHFDFEFDAPFSSRPARPKVSSEEQMRILEMLQEGKISVEEAEMLLKALEG